MSSSPVLVATSLDDITSNFVIEALNSRKVPVVRVDTADIGNTLSFAASPGAGRWQGALRTATRDLDLSRVRSVYHRRPSPYRFDHLPDQAALFAAAEARFGFGGLLAALPVPHVNDPFATARAEYKPLQLTVAGAVGLPVPATLITNDLDAVRSFEDDHGPIIYKTFRGVPSTNGLAGVVWTGRVSAQEIDASVAVTAHLFQAEVDKTADVRATMVGDELFAYLVDATDAELTHPLDWRSGHWDALKFTQVAAPVEFRKGMRTYLDQLGLVSGSFDFTVDRAGDWAFIECNPDGQWAFLPDPELIGDAFAFLLEAG